MVTQERLELPRFICHPIFPLTALLGTAFAIVVAANLLYPHDSIAAFKAHDVFQLRRDPVAGVVTRPDHNLATLADLRGRHIWAVAQLLELIAMVLTAVYALWLLFKPDEPQPRNTAISCSAGDLLERLRKSLDTSLVCKAARWMPLHWRGFVTLVAVCSVTCAIVFPFLSGPLNPFDLAGRVHGDLFTQAFELSGTPQLTWAVWISDQVALLMAFAVIAATMAVLVEGCFEPSTEDLISLAACDAFLSRNRLASRRVQFLAGLTSATLAVAILQMNALAHFPACLLDNEAHTHLVEQQADSATFAAGSALSLLLVALFGSAALALDDSEQSARKRVESLGGSTEQFTAESSPSISTRAITIGKLFLPLLAGTIAGYVGIKIK